MQQNTRTMKSQSNIIETMCFLSQFHYLRTNVTRTRETWMSGANFQLLATSDLAPLCPLRQGSMPVATISEASLDSIDLKKNKSCCE